MRYQVFSLQQSALVEYGLSVEDALLLDWILHWKDGSTMKREYIEDVEDIGYWVNYETVVKELPILFKQPTDDMDEKELNKLLRNNKDKVGRLLRGNLSKVLTPHKKVYKGAGAKQGSMIFVTLKRECIDKLRNIGNEEKQDNKKSPTYTEVEDTQKSKKSNFDNSIPQNEENETQNLEKNKIDNENNKSDAENNQTDIDKLDIENNKVDAYKIDFEQLAYERCLRDIEGFETMDSMRKEFLLGAMLRKISLGDN